MNNPIFWRLVWKEYRLMRSFWIAMAVLAVILELIACISVWSPNDSVQMIFAMALVLPAFYAMGCGATLFATEHETGTYQFQRALPVSASRLFFFRKNQRYFSLSSPLASLGSITLVPITPSGSGYL